MKADDGAVATWREAFAVFERISALDGAARAQELAALASARPEAHRLVAKLLAGYEGTAAEGLLDGALIGGEAFAAAAPLHAGAALGPYTLERLLGQGGMGEVWLAHRADGRYQGTVAVKTLHPYLARPEVRERFRREGQIVARLSHPNIARLYDAGASADGLLYLVFEYVQGERIDHWCDGRRLDLAARIRLFLEVCEAVTQAHTQLIVHRDLKPSNILVTPQGQVKLLDFGIAKLIEAEGAEAMQTELTRLGGRALTPEYAAPEQVLGEAVTTVTDVYSLGVLLYLLLSGSRPYGGAGTTAAQLERSVVETEPLALAAAASRTVPGAVGPQHRAAQRATSPARLKKALAGDLGNIVGKALRKSPAQRYPSVMALAEDLRRYLDHRPVEARPAAFGYRAAKYLRRHRAGVAVAAALLLAVAAGIVGVLWQAHAAQVQAQRADRVKDFVVSVFREQDPLGRQGSSLIPAQQMIGEAIGHADEELQRDPGLHAELLDDLGSIQYDLGDPAAAAATLQRAAAQYRLLYGADSPQLAASLRELAWPLGTLNRHDEARQAAAQALGILDRLGEAHSVEGARAKWALAVAQAWGNGSPPASIALLKDACRSLEAGLGPQDPETMQALYELASMEEQGRQDAEAETQLREVILRYEARYGPDTVHLAQPLRVLALVLARNGKPEEAEALYLRDIALTRAAFGPQNQLLASELAAEGGLYADVGQYDEAVRALQDCGAAIPAGDDRERIDQLKELGRAYLGMGRADDGEAALHQAFELVSKDGGEARGYTWYVAAEWGRAVAAQGRLKDAEAIQRQALDRLGQIMGADAYQNCLLIDALAETLEKRGGHAEELLALRRRALALTAKAYPQTSPLWAERAANLARALVALDTPAARDEATPLLDQAATVYRAKSTPRDKAGETLVLRAGLEIGRGQAAAARADLEDALDRLQHEVDADPSAMTQAHALLRQLDRG